ncbi:MAG: GNAT family N-acetyltransferase [Bacteroidia bacterium]|jgi:putative acetyltransferase
MSKPEISLRPVKTSDLIDLQTLFVDTITHVCNADYTPDQIRVWSDSINNLPSWINKIVSQYFVVAELDNKMVGYCSLENNNYIDFLYVHKDYQGRGIANKLYAEIEAEAIRCNGNSLNSDVSITARPFFEKKGFQVIQKRISKIAGTEIVNFKMSKLL